MSMSEPPIPKYVTIAQVLRQRIVDGQYAQGSRLPSENELPAQFGVGKQTIVRVMSELMREGLIERRQGKGSFVSRTPQRQARSSASERSRVLRIGIVLWRSIENFEWSERSWAQSVARGVAAGLGMPREGLVLLAQAAQPGHATRMRFANPASQHVIEIVGEPRELDSGGVPLQELFEDAPDALVPLSIFNERYLHDLIDRAAPVGVPVVIADYWTKALGKRADCVVADNLPGYLGACEAFLARGCRRIHFVGVYAAGHTPGHFKNGRKAGIVEPDSYLRLSAYRQAMDAAGIEVAPEWITFVRPHRNFAEELAEQMASLQENERPDAVVCHSAEHAEAMSKVFARRRLALPTVGAGAAGESKSAYRIELDPEEIGRSAALLLHARMEEQSRHRTPREGVKIAVPTRFIQDERTDL